MATARFKTISFVSAMVFLASAKNVSMMVIASLLSCLTHSWDPMQ